LNVADFLDEKRQEIAKRLQQLQPLVDEFRRLESAAAALAGVGVSAANAATRRGRTARRGPGRPRASAAGSRTATATRTKKAKTTRRAAGTTTRRAGRRKGSGTRAAQALQFVKGQPGITIPELAAKMGIKQNYLYRVLPGLEQEGKVTKRGRGWFPK